MASRLGSDGVEKWIPIRTLWALLRDLPADLVLHTNWLGNLVLCRPVSPDQEVPVAWINLVDETLNWFDGPVTVQSSAQTGPD